MKRIGMLATLAFLMIGCGSGSNSSGTGINSVDNSKLSTGKNSMGYYGDKVKFGNHTAARRWTYTAKTNNSVTDFICSTGDGGYVVKNGRYDSFDYGFSQDGKLMNFVFDGHNWSMELLNTTTDYCYNAKALLKDDGQYSTGIICAEK